MNEIQAKVAYLHGLAEGLDLDTTSSEGRVLSSVLDVLDDLAEQVSDVLLAHSELAEYVETVDMDLSGLEERVYGDPEDLTGVHFAPDQPALIGEEADGTEIILCPNCGEALGARFGEVETGVDVLCPTCGSLVYDEGDDLEDSGFQEH